MGWSDPAGPGPPSGSAHAYGRDALHYDARTAVYDRYRRLAIDLLPVTRGETVADIGCGTGLCFEPLVERVGPEGTVIGVKPAPEMRRLAARRIADCGWANVVLVASAVETAVLPAVDHALFCAVHDVLQSPTALDNVLTSVRDDGESLRPVARGHRRGRCR